MPSRASTLDISLPDGSGVEVLKQIRRRGWDLCVMVFTGNPCEGLRQMPATGGRGGLRQVKRVGTGSAGPAGGAIRSGNPLEIALLMKNLDTE
jgi:CheY-like chemotaxis protein